MQSSAYKGPNRNYLNYVRSLAKPTKHLHNCLRAFIVGGLICCVGQFLRIEFQALFALEGEELAGAVSMSLIFLGCLLTGLGVYDRIGKAAGAGSIVPITGFANSVALARARIQVGGADHGACGKDVRRRRADHRLRRRFRHRSRG